MNKLIDQYINLLIESTQPKLNAPELAFYTLYGYVANGIRGSKYKSKFNI